MNSLRRRILLALIGVSLVGLAVDKLVFHGGPTVSEAALDDMPTSSPAGGEGGPQPVATTQQPIPELPFPTVLPGVGTTPSRDWFKMPLLSTMQDLQELEQTVSGGAGTAAPKRTEPRRFEDRFHLTGVIRQGDAWAVINQHWLREGDTLSGSDCVVSEIAEQHVILDCRGEKKTLLVFKNVLSHAPLNQPDSSDDITEEQMSTDAN